MHHAPTCAMWWSPSPEELKRADDAELERMKAFAAAHGLELVPCGLMDRAAADVDEVAKDISQSFAKVCELAKRVRRLANNLEIIERPRVRLELYEIADDMEEL
jgi:hypothetical protein